MPHLLCTWGIPGQSEGPLSSLCGFSLLETLKCLSVELDKSLRTVAFECNKYCKGIWGYISKQF